MITRSWKQAIPEYWTTLKNAWRKKWGEVERYVAGRETNRRIKKRAQKGKGITRVSPVVDSSSSSTYTSAAEDERKSGHGRSIKRRTALSDGEDRLMSQEAPSTPR